MARLPLWSKHRNQTGLSPGSIASPSAVAHVIEEKYVMAVPLYRQEKQWERRGVKVSRQNMANWIMAAQHWLQPIYDRMKQVLLSQDIILPMKPLSRFSRKTAKKLNPVIHVAVSFRTLEGSPGNLWFFRRASGECA
jgi:hypothetical protein